MMAIAASSLLGWICKQSFACSASHHAIDNERSNFAQWLGVTVLGYLSRLRGWVSPGDTESRRPCCMDRICGARFSVEASTFSTCIGLGSLTIPHFAHFSRNPLFFWPWKFLRCDQSRTAWWHAYIFHGSFSQLVTCKPPLIGIWAQLLEYRNLRWSFFRDFLSAFDIDQLNQPGILGMERSQDL